MSSRRDVQLVRLDAESAHLLGAASDDVFDDEIDPRRVASLLESGQLVVVAIDGGLVVGQVQAMIQHHLDGPPQLYIDNLGVASTHRRHGIAGRLVSDVIEWSRGSGCVQTWIVTETDNDEANAFYRSLGAERETVALYSLDG